VAQALIEEDEYEEEDFLDDQQVAAYCPGCGDGIRLTEEVFLISFARAYRTPAQVALREVKPDGLPVGMPWFYCFECWEVTKEELQEGCEDVLPIEDVYDQGLLECDICRSDICEGETFALETFGEIHWSKRSPSGMPAMALEAMGEAKHICIDCISNAEDNDQFQLEVHDYDDQETCAVGRHLRCWRDRSRCVHCPRNKQ
jgi:hypothetical protein